MKEDENKLEGWGEEGGGEATEARETEETQTEEDNIARGKAVSKGDREKVGDERR